MNKIFDSRDYTSCPHGRRYWDMSDDCCRMCEYRDDCPLDPDNFDPIPDCLEDEINY